MYCTKADILDQVEESKLIALTDDAGTGAVDDAKIDRAIADADALIDSHCGRRYAVPFATVPTIIRAKSVDMAIYNLYARKKGVPEIREKRYDAAIRFLERVADGKVDLGVQPPPAAPDAADCSGGMVVSTRSKIFGPDTMDKF